MQIKSVRDKVVDSEICLYMPIAGISPRKTIVVPVWNAMGYFSDIINKSLYREYR